MRFSRTAIWTTAAVLGFASVSFAQRPGGFGGRGGGGRSIVAIAGNEAVQKETGIGADAKEKITKLATAMSEEIRSEAGSVNLREASAEERRAAMAKLTEVRTKAEAKFVPQLKEILSADQFKRVREIHLQDQGAAALNNAEFAKELGVSEEQQKKIADIVKDYGNKTRALFQGGGDGGGRESFAKVQELNKERDEKVLGVLDAGQKEKFEAAKGKAFDLAQLRQGPGGNRPGRPQN